jgi:hypothetical protein
MTHTSRRLSDSQHTHLNPQHSANALKPTARAQTHPCAQADMLQANESSIVAAHGTCVQERTLVYLEDSMALLQQRQKMSVLLYRERVKCLLWSVYTQACFTAEHRRTKAVGTCMYVGICRINLWMYVYSDK